MITLQVRKFGSARLKLFASPAYLAAHGAPRKLADLSGHEILIHSRFPPGLVLTGDNGERFEITQTARARADDMHSVRAFAEHGLGIGCCRRSEVAPEVKLVHVLPEIGPDGEPQLRVPGRQVVPVNVRAFLDLTLEMIPG
jgi:LysR family transcriptional regulator AphB